jgi:hypothetical protein
MKGVVAVLGFFFSSGAIKKVILYKLNIKIILYTKISLSIN